MYDFTQCGSLICESEWVKGENVYVTTDTKIEEINFISQCNFYPVVLYDFFSDEKVNIIISGRYSISSRSTWSAPTKVAGRSNEKKR